MIETLLTLDRIDAIRMLFPSADVDGAVAEVGVYRGGILRMLAAQFPERTVYGFDTFTGLPAEKFEDGEYHQPGEFNETSLAYVQSVMAPFTNVKLHAGIFPDSVRGTSIENERFAFVHNDLDYYRSVLEALEWFYPRMTPGGIMVLDDYEWKNCPGVKRACDEFFVDKPEDVLVCPYTNPLQKSAYFIKG